MQALRNYFAHLDGQAVCDVYNLVLSEVEAPLLETVMHYVKGNQTRASELLGLNRGTLRGRRVGRKWLIPRAAIQESLSQEEQG